VFWYYIIPGAFVKIDTDALKETSGFTKLKISCAGAWHNFVLSWASFLILKSLPFLLQIGYDLHSEKGLLLLKAMDENGNLFLKNKFLISVNDVPINGGIQQLETVVHDLGNFETIGPSRCSHNPIKYPNCCSSKEILLNKEFCLWDVESIQQYRSIPNMQSLNVIPKTCMEYDANYIELPICQSSSDCHIPAICISPFFGDDRQVFRMQFEDPLWNTLSNLTLIGKASEFHGAVLLSAFTPKYKWLSFSLPLYVEIFWR
jgi:S2P endopeptidase